MLPADFSARISTLSGQLVEQGRRVQAQLETCFEALFTADPARAQQAVTLDDAIDNADVAIEQAAVSLLTEATRAGAQLEPAQLRAVLTIVKVNNELERVADAGVDVAELVKHALQGAAAYPPTFRIMANSVIGILRDTNTAFATGNPGLAKVVIQSQHAVTEFKNQIVRQAEEQIARGLMTTDFAFRLHEVGGQCETIADHCTNIAEQIIYAATGAIVRHADASRVEVRKPATE
jgi:phosphate transport system protein